MKIQGKEIIAGDNKVVCRKTDTAFASPFSRATLLPGETLESFVEIDKADIPSEELREAIEAKIAEIDAYDKSSAVNQFYLNDIPCWLDRDTRVSLMNSTNIVKASGQESTVLWLNGQVLTIPCDTAIALLGQLEIYALACYNRTAEHKANVSNLTNVNSVKAYDHTTGYPEKLNLKF